MKNARKPQTKAPRGARRQIAIAKTSAATEPAPGPAAPDFALAFFERVNGVLFCIAIEPGEQFRFLAANEFFLSATGLQRAQVVGKLVEEVIPEPSLSTVLKKYREAIRTRQTVRWEETSRYPTGEKHGEVAVTPFFDAQGQATHLFGIVFDTTERRQAELSLRESEARYARAVSGANDGLWEWNISTGETYLSPRWKALLGFAPDELPDDRESAFLSRLHPDDVERVASVRRRHFEGRSPYEVEARLRMKDGSYRWFLIRGRAQRDDGGRPVVISGTIADITPRREAEVRYQRERDFIETLVNLTSAIIVLLDRQGRMVYVNDATLRLLGYERSDLLNRTPWEAGLMDPAETRRAKERLARLLAGEPNPPREAILRGKDGRRHYVELTSTSTRTPDNEADRIIVTGTDLTERHHLQQEILRISEEEQARIGHNLHDGIGQTMTGISALMEGLESELAGAQRATAARIRQLIQDAILEVRHMSHGLSPAAVRNRGLAGALQLLAETIRLNHRTACELEVDPAIRLDDTERETHIYRIAQEAANNALRHGKPRAIKITLHREGENECVMEVHDDGSGIARPAKGRASGIGIRVMDYRASCIKGVLEVKSARGRGTTVICRFPMADPLARDEAIISPPEPPPEAEMARDI